MDPGLNKPELPSLFVKDASFEKLAHMVSHNDLFFPHLMDFSIPKGELLPPMLFPAQYEEFIEPQEPREPIAVKKRKSIHAKSKYSSKSTFNMEGLAQEHFYCNMCSREFRHKSDVIRHVNNGCLHSLSAFYARAM